MCLSSCLLLHWYNYTCKNKCSILVCWDVTLHHWVSSSHFSEGTCCPYLQGFRVNEELLFIDLELTLS